MHQHGPEELSQLLTQFQPWSKLIQTTGEQPTFQCVHKSLGTKSHFLSDLHLSDFSSEELFELHYYIFAS